MYIFSNSAQVAKLEAEEKALTEQTAIEKDQESKINIEIQAEKKVAIDNNDSLALARKMQESFQNFGDFANNVSGTEKTISIENDLLKIEFSNKGAQIKNLELKKFKKWNKEPLMLISETQVFNFNLETKSGKKIATKDLFFDINKMDEKTVSLKIKVSENQYIEHLYTLEDGSYVADFDVNFVNLDQIVDTENVSLEWDLRFLQKEKELLQEKRKSTVYWKVKNDDVDHLSLGSSKEEDVLETDWLGFKTQYFNVTFLADNQLKSGFVQSKIDNDDTTKVSDLHSKMNLNLSNKNNFQFYFGPNDLKILGQFENGQEEMVELSADFFLFAWVKHINKWVVVPLFHLLEKTNLPYGLLIILLTLIIRMAMMPLTFKSYVSTAKTKLLKPQLDALKEKHKDDQSKFASEQMKLYQSTGVSMFGGCLPMMLQMPFFLAMFYFFPSAIELRQESFLWATDLSSYDVLVKLPFNIPMYGAHISGFTLLMTISSLVSARFNPQMQNQNLQPGMEMMKYMPYIFPFFLMIMFNTWAAGLTLYYFVSNVVTLSQQLFINKFMIDEEKLMAQIEENKKKEPKKGGFRAKLADAYKQQQLVEQQKNKNKKSK